MCPVLYWLCFWYLFFLRLIQTNSGLKVSLLSSALGTCAVVLSWQGILGRIGTLEDIGAILLLSFLFGSFSTCSLLVWSPTSYWYNLFREVFYFNFVFLTFSVPFQRPEQQALLLSPAIHQQQLQIFFYSSLNATVDRVPHWPSLASYLKLQVTEINKNIFLCILLIIRRIVFNDKTNHFYTLNTLSNKKEKHKFHSQSETCPISGCKTLDGLISLSHLKTYTF